LVISWATPAAVFDHGPYSGAPSADSVTISWLTSPPLAACVTYATASAYEALGTMDGEVIVPAPDDASMGTVHVVLEGLAPDTTYVYRVVVQSGSSAIESLLGRFQTEPASGETVTFAVLADTQWQWKGANRMEMVADAIAANSSDLAFVLHAGDLVESPSSHYWDHWFSSFDDMLLAAPFIPVLGNHERNHRTYYDLFAHPPGEGKNSERWWALHWGDVVVVGLDTNVRRADEIRAQQAWAERHLSGPEPHKFVIFHHPIWSSDAFHGGGYSYDVIYHPIFVEAGADVVFNGHAHNYERLQRDGVIYLVLGGGGATPRPLADSLVDGSIVAIEDRHFYARVSTSPSGITAEIVSVASAAGKTVTATPDEILDTFVLPAKERPGRSAAGQWSALIAVAAIAVIAALALIRGSLR